MRTTPIGVVLISQFEVIMIKVTRLSGDEIYINADLIEFVESTPDTMITLTTGRKFIIKEGVDFVMNSVIDYRKKLLE